MCGAVVQSAPNTTKVVISNPAHGRCIRYKILWKSVSVL